MHPCTAIRGWSEEIVGRSLIRYSAVACIAAGGLFMGGTGAVAFADTPGDGTGDAGPSVDNGTQAPQPTAAPRGFRIPNWMRLPGFRTTAGDTRRAGFIPPPVMNLPATLGSSTAPGGSSTTRRAPTITVPFAIENPTNPTKPVERQSAGADTATVPDNTLPAVVDVNAPSQGNVTSPSQGDVTSPTQGDVTSPATKPAGTTNPKPPTINLVPLVPRDVPMGPPLTIQNPLRQLLPADIDFDQPITEQLLPTPLVALLTAVSQQIPLAGLVISPVIEFADMVIPLLLSDVVLPTPQLAATVPTAIPKIHPLVGKPAPTVLARNAAPPVDLAPMGMDMFVPASPQQPLPLSSGVEAPQAPPAPPAPDSGVASLSDPVAYRAGYSDYLRNAGMAQITAIAVPGAAAILLFSLGGGFIGYRQARAGHVIRAEGITRFLR